MRGFSHVVSGLAGASVVSCIVPGLATDKLALATSVALIAGGAILPDIDHPGATISRSMPPLTYVVSRVVSFLSGGHRKGTHSMFGWVLFGVAAYGLAQWTISASSFTIGPIHTPETWGVGTGVLAGFLAGVALTALKLDPLGLPSWVVALIMALVGATSNVDPTVVGVAVCLGAMIHSVVGDMLTSSGVPLFYPIIPTSFALPVLGATGSTRERIYVGVLAMVALGAPVATHYIH